MRVSPTPSYSIVCRVSTAPYSVVMLSAVAATRALLLLTSDRLLISWLLSVSPPTPLSPGRRRRVAAMRVHRLSNLCPVGQSLFIAAVLTSVQFVACCLCQSIADGAGHMEIDRRQAAVEIDTEIIPDPSVIVVRRLFVT